MLLDVKSLADSPDTETMFKESGFEPEVFLLRNLFEIWLPAKT